MSEEPSAGDATLSADLVQRIRRVCDRFEAAWRAGERPRIEEYLDADSATGPERLPLLRELIVLDVAYRRRGAENPRPEDYQKRFPALDQDWLVNLITAKSHLHLRPGAILASRYEILNEVDRGTMGAVYRARHQTLDMRVSSSTVPPSANRSINGCFPAATSSPRSWRVASITRIRCTWRASPSRCWARGVRAFPKPYAWTRCFSSYPGCSCADSPWSAMPESCSSRRTQGVPLRHQEVFRFQASRQVLWSKI